MAEYRSPVANSLFERALERSARRSRRRRGSRSLGVTLDTSCATERGLSLERQDDRPLGRLPAVMVGTTRHLGMSVDLSFLAVIQLLSLVDPPSRSLGAGVPLQERALRITPRGVPMVRGID